MFERGSVARHPATWLSICAVCVAGYEGYSGHVYRDSVGVPTICYGQTAYDGADFSKTYTKAECTIMLQKDLPKYDAPLKRCLKSEVYDALPPYRHAALVSLSYNVGAATVCRSSIVRELNRGNIEAACDDFLLYNRGGGRVIQGLENRREAERKLCLMEN